MFTCPKFSAITVSPAVSFCLYASIRWQDSSKSVDGFGQYFRSPYFWLGTNWLDFVSAEIMVLQTHKLARKIFCFRMPCATVPLLALLWDKPGVPGTIVIRYDHGRNGALEEMRASNHFPTKQQNNAKLAFNFRLIFYQKILRNQISVCAKIYRRKRETGWNFQVDLQVDSTQNRLESTWNFCRGYRAFRFVF